MQNISATQFYCCNIDNMNLDTHPYIFPRRLSRDYHGPSKPRQKLASIHRQKFREQKMQNDSQHNPQHHTYKVSDIFWQSRRLDRDVIEQRNQLITHSTRVSKDTPEWWKSTFKYFQTIDQQANSKKGPNSKQFDVFNRKKDDYMTIQNERMDNLYQNQSSIVRSSDKNERFFNSSNRSFQSARKDKDEVSPKVGSLQKRDFSIRKPLLKIGKDNYIDTYSVF